MDAAHAIPSHIEQQIVITVRIEERQGFNSIPCARFRKIGKYIDYDVSVVGKCFRITIIHHEACRTVVLAMFKSKRRALLTASSVGNAAATSGASRTIFEPAAKRCTYFPRTPFL